MSSSAKPQKRTRKTTPAASTVKPATVATAAASSAKPATVAAGIDDAVAGLPQAQTGAAIDGPSMLFDPDWYRTEYPDVAAAGIDPIRHYFDDGAREGRDPNPFFATSSYVARYADVAASRMNPFLHYLLYGAREGRTPKG